MLTTIAYIIIFFLTVQILPTAIGVGGPKKWLFALSFVVIAVAIQSLTFYGGYGIGSRLLHLTTSFKNVIFFIGFFLIGIRMLMDSFQVRKGERTFVIDSYQSMIVAVIGQSVNTLLAGMLFYYIPELVVTNMMGFLAAAVLFVALLGIMMQRGRLGFVLASLLYFLGGMSMVIASVYVGFFKL